jgi:beta-hydroxyacyl-ACP dehydratase FabZ
MTSGEIGRLVRQIPTQYPFVLVDRILEHDARGRLVAAKSVTGSEDYFAGHFPGQPVMPGVLIVEAMAQLSGVLLLRKLEHTGKVAYLVSMDKVKIRRPVVPGDQLVIEVIADRVKSRTGHVTARATVASRLVAEAELTFMMADTEPM